jgi:hypothetical protein
MPRPRPLAAPVTMAFLLSNLNVLAFCFRG